MTLPTEKSGASNPPQTVVNDNASEQQAFDASWFARDRRIHIEDGSHFYAQHHLMIHPDELNQENHQRLFTKIIKHYSLPHPTFFTFFPRNAVMFALASYLPVSKEARLESLQKATEKLQEQVKTGVHPDSDKQIQQYDQPLSAFTKLRADEPDVDPIDREFLTNSIALYLVMNEALKLAGLAKEAASYVQHLQSPDATLADLTRRLHVDFSTFVQTAQRDGIDGIATLLNVPDAAVAEIKQISALASEHEFADNLIMNWDMGRRIPGMESRNIEEKVAVGALQHTAGMMQHLQQTVGNQAITPKYLPDQEQMIVSMMRELPSVMQEALYYSGTEFGFVHGRGLGKIDPSLNRVLGRHLHVPFERGGSNGLRQILVSNLDHVHECRRTFHHEAHHLMFPEKLSKTDIQTMDTLMKESIKRLSALKESLDEWKKEADPNKRTAIEQRIDQQFRVGDIGLDQALSRQSDNPVSMDSLRNWVDHALHNLDPHSLSLTKGYGMPELRAAEIIARFSELLYVDLADNPAMLAFITPEMMVTYHDHYMPHIESQIETFKQEQAALPANLRYLGLPPGAQLPSDQQQAMQLVASARPTPPNEPEAEYQHTPKAPNSTVETGSIQIPRGVETYLNRIDPINTIDPKHAAESVAIR